jgi:hypothetical protein
MKNLIYPVLLLLFAQCGTDTRNKDRLVKAQEKSYSMSRGSKEDLVETLYQELVQEKPELKKLEADLKKWNESKYANFDTFKKYDQNSVQYYQSAQSKIASMKDSLLKNKMLSIIHKSKEDYQSRHKGLSEVIQGIDTTNYTVADYHTILKIVSTLPLIHTYQKEHLPNIAGFKEVAKIQQRIIKTMDSLAQVK